jgi:hypothetical protein
VKSKKIIKHNIVTGGERDFGIKKNQHKSDRKLQIMATKGQERHSMTYVKFHSAILYILQLIHIP